MYFFVAAKNGLKEAEAKDFLLMMDAIQKAPNLDGYNKNRSKLINSMLYKTNDKLRKYVDRMWLSIPEVQIYFSPHKLNILAWGIY